MSSSTPAALQARNLSVRYGATQAIDRLSLTVPAGCIYALLGGNGAGKSTTLSVFLGFVQPSAGEVHAGGTRIDQRPRSARGLVSYLPENVALYPYLTGLENLRYFAALAGLRLSTADASARLTQAGLQADAHAVRTQAYSKGMRQKVGLAIAYAKGAIAMLLDEPTSGLDPAATNDFSAHLKRAAQNGMGILMATHDLFNAIQVADRIGIMRAGRLVSEFDKHSISHAELEAAYLAQARELP
ncbi:putative ABC transporter ATP-binding protein YbhF [compost metagenome]|uniref:ABC transporter ATP-binding protein n=1 Tax=Achromobacter sp. Root83 TaxID=1736602 RepID=UPI00070E0A44|nr:ABC transporter ATP-binding protein [Achromobacter sp. Root83]KRC71822.1 ABC transporter ATP-binding protein [Achromobacter sp. Root83]